MESSKNGRWIIPFKKFSGSRWNGGLMDKVSSSQPQDRGFKTHTGHDHESAYYDTSTGWFQETDERVIFKVSCENLFHK